MFPISLYIVKKNKDVVFKHISKVDFSESELKFNIDDYITERLKYFPEHIGTEFGTIIYDANSLIDVDRKTRNDTG